MAKKTKKFYGVLKGRKPGIYTSWAECQKQVSGFSEAAFKGFMTRQEAEEYVGLIHLGNGKPKTAVKKTAISRPVPKREAGVITMTLLPEDDVSGITEDIPQADTVIYVDGSYALGQYGWGFAVYQDGELIHTAKGKGDSKLAAQLHNVAGEVEAATQAVLWSEAQGLEHITICHDYTGIAMWATGGWRTNNLITSRYAQFMESRRDFITFCKVAGHTGVAGNELADKLARESLGLD